VDKDRQLLPRWLRAVPGKAFFGPSFMRCPVVALKASSEEPRDPVRGVLHPAISSQQATIMYTVRMNPLVAGSQGGALAGNPSCSAETATGAVWRMDGHRRTAISSRRDYSPNCISDRLLRESVTS